MKYRLSKIFLFLILFCSISNSQRLLKISAEINGSEKVLSYITKAGNTFVSAKEIGALLSANSFYNKDASKLELKFPEYIIKFTAKTQFVVLTRKSNNSQNIFQLPISTLLINDDVFIPIIYTCDYLSLCFGKKIIYNGKDKKLDVTDIPFNSLSLINDKITVKSSPEKDTIGNPPQKPDSLKYDIYGIVLEEKSNGTLIRLKNSRKINTPRHSIVDNKLFVFLSKTSVAPDLMKNINPVGLIKDGAQTLVSGNNVQLEFNLDEGYSSSEILRDSESDDIIITVHKNIVVKPNTKNRDVKSKWIFDTVVIDAGHGGKDPGAIGVTGIKEKIINLGIATKLGKLIEINLPSVKVIYTRKKDEFVELYKRGKIANEADGKLFISIHCNSTPQKDIKNRGFEVYLLRPGRTKRAIEIAEFENNVISFEDNPSKYQKLTDENFILVSMAHSQYMRFSEKFSDVLNQAWKKEVEIPSLGIKQAGFYVLVGASMPSVLIESGFLSNRKDEAYLASAAGQNEIAEAVFNSIKQYKEYYDKEIEILGNENVKQSK
jgi:N-acetylmuramoyl-L-alanine amidase